MESSGLIFFRDTLSGTAEGKVRAGSRYWMYTNYRHRSMIDNSLRFIAYDHCTTVLV